jgi:nucleotide-binding universal stress UspA family protein
MAIVRQLRMVLAAGALARASVIYPVTQTEPTTDMKLQRWPLQVIESATAHCRNWSGGRRDRADGRARCSIADRWTEMEVTMYARIIVPLDGSELAEVVLPHAGELAHMTGAPVHLVRVVDVVTGNGFGSFVALEAAAHAEVINLEEIEARRYLNEMQERLSSRGFTVTTEIRRGPASHEITSVARPEDVIVMATHGRGGLQRWLLGSVAEAVVRHSPAPVLLVRADGITVPESDGVTTVGAGARLEPIS